MGKSRPNFERYSIVLRFCLFEHRLPLHIMSELRTSWKYFESLLGILVSYNLLDVLPVVNENHISGKKSRRRVVYRTSNKGREFLKMYDTMMELLR